MPVSINILPLLDRTVTVRSPGYAPAADGSITSTSAVKAAGVAAAVQQITGNQTTIDGMPVEEATSHVFLATAPALANGDFLTDDADGQKYEVTNFVTRTSVAGSYASLLAKLRHE